MTPASCFSSRSMQHQTDNTAQRSHRAKAAGLPGGPCAVVPPQVPNGDRVICSFTQTG